MPIEKTTKKKPRNIHVKGECFSTDVRFQRTDANDIITAFGDIVS